MFPDFPQAVFIQTRTGCNSDCVICPSKKAFQKFGFQEMENTLFEKILDDLSDNYKGQIGLYLHFEPLLDERLFDFIDLAKKRCPLSSVEISSNGALLDKEKQKKLSGSKVDLVYFNFNGGSKEVYEQQMKGLNFERSLKNIKDFRKIYSGKIRINFVLTNDNFHQKEEVRKLFPFPDFEVIDCYWAVNRVGNVLINKPSDAKTRFSDDCKQLEMNLPILATGDVILCCNDWMREVVIGNVRNENLLNLWRSHKKHYNYEICRRCF